VESLLHIGLTNAVAAAVLAILVVLITQRWQNPHLAHAMWLIVLFRLVAPPLLPISVPLPDWLATTVAGNLVSMQSSPQSTAGRATPERSTEAAIVNSQASTASAASTTRDPAPFRAGTALRTNLVDIRADVPTSDLPRASAANTITVADALVGIWIAGTVFYIVIIGWRVRRFASALRRLGCEQPLALQAEVSAIAATIRLVRVPRLAVVDGLFPPMIWCGRRATLLVPRSIIDGFEPSKRRLLLLHELMHVRRGDHLVRWFAIAVLALSWWNPIAWWAVRRLQNAEEECCDAAVLFYHPQGSRDYGETLLLMSERLSHVALPAAAVSIGVERKSQLKRRMTMILDDHRWPRLSRRQRAALLACGFAFVAVSWKLYAAQAMSPNERGRSAETASLPEPGIGVPAVSHPSGVSLPARGIQPKDAFVAQATPPVADTPTAAVTSSNASGPATKAEASTGKGPAARTESAPPKSVSKSPPHSSTPAVPSIERVTTAVARPRPAYLTAKPVSPAPGDDELHKLEKERYNAALNSLQSIFRSAEEGVAHPFDVVTAGRTLLAADLALHQGQDVVDVYKRYLELTQSVENWTQSLWKTGQLRIEDRDAAREAVLDAQIKLLQAERRTPAVNEPAKADRQAVVTVELRKAELQAAAATIAQAEADLKGAMASLKYQDVKFARFKTLHERQEMGDLALEKSRADLDSAQASMEAARAVIEHAKALYAVKQAELAMAQAQVQLLQMERAPAAFPMTAKPDLHEAAVQIKQGELRAVQATVTEGEAQLKRAQAYAIFRKIQLRRIEDLFKQKAIDERLVEEARKADAAAQRDVEAAATSLQRSKAQLHVKQLDVLIELSRPSSAKGN
jgi:beta-lactamase regulating signal transducer with metallopeptidase domain/multidrug resistance efflux pump